MSKDVKKISVFEQVYNLFIDQARKENDVQVALKAWFPDLLDSIVSDLDDAGVKQFRSLSYSTKPEDLKNPDTAVLLCVRAFDGTGEKVVSFSNGSTPAVATFNWLQRLVSGDLQWKTDTPGGGSGSAKTIFDAVSGPSK